MNLSIAPAVLAAFPGLTVTGLIADCQSAANLDGAAARLFGRVAAQGSDGAVQVVDIPVVREWRETYRKMGLKPADHRSSVESLIRRALRGGFPTVGIGTVDLYNACSALMQTPMGAYDLDRVGNADITVRFADPEADEFNPIGGHPERFPLIDRVVVYGQPGRVLCWAFNCRDNADTSVLGSTRRALFLSEAVNAAAAQTSRAAVEFLAQALRGAGAVITLLATADANSPTLEIPALAPDTTGKVVTVEQGNES